MAKEKEEKVVLTPEEQLRTYLKDNKEDHYNFAERVNWRISTGSMALDIATGGITPSLVRFCGHNNSGKTPQALEVMRNFLATVPNSRGIFVIAEGRLSQENQNRTGLKFVTSAEEWKDGTIFVFETNIYETVIGLIKETVLNNPSEKRYCFCIDSLDGLILKGDVQKSAEDSHKVAGPQLLTKKMLQSLSIGMFKYGHLLLLISQVTSEVKIDPYAKTATRDGNFSGGNAVEHWADFVLEFQPAYQNDYILDNPDGKVGDGKSKTLGNWCKVKMVKSTLEASKRQVIKYPIKNGKKPSGVWIEYEIGDLLLQWEMARSKGAWVTIEDSLIKELSDNKLTITKQHNGIKALRSYLEENPEITQYLYQKFKTLISQ